jgi:iron only hydrogenase large subunit-like protein
MAKSTKSPTWPSQARNNHSGLFDSLSSVTSPQPLKEMLLPRSLDLNISFEIKYRR